MIEENENSNRRNVTRLSRHPEHNWTLAVDGDLLITKNISNISPTGLSFKAPASTELHPGQILRLNMILNKDETFDCEGKVVWATDREESNGPMRQLGVQFLNIPARVDAAIMREIHDSILRHKRMAVKRGERPQTSLTAHLGGRLTPGSILATAFWLLMLVVLTTAFVTAIYLHQRTHPQDGIEYQFNKAFTKRMLHLK